MDKHYVKPHTSTDLNLRQLILFTYGRCNGIRFVYAKQYDLVNDYI